LASEDVAVDDLLGTTSELGSEGADSGMTAGKEVVELPSEVAVDDSVDKFSELGFDVFWCGTMVGAEPVGTAFSPDGLLSTGGWEEPDPVSGPGPESLENVMGFPSSGVIEGLVASETGGWFVDDSTLEAPRAMPDVSLEGPRGVVGVIVGVGTITEAFVGPPPTDNFEPLSSTKTVSGTMTTVVDGLPGPWRSWRGALPLNSRLTNRGK
jgi:hypothetical protein